MPIHLYYIIRYLKFLPKSHSTRGFGIHSPFVFDLATNTLGATLPFYAYPAIERTRRNLLYDESPVAVTDYGTGNDGERRICDIAQKSLKPARQAQLLHRLAVRMNPRNIVELGSSLGITTAYLAATDSRRPVYTIEGSDSLLQIARSGWRNLGLTNIHAASGRIEDLLGPLLDELGTVGMVFADANHTFEATLRYWQLLLGHTDRDSILVLDDIHWSEGMEQAWQKICTHPKVSLSLDLFHLGIVFFNPDMPHEQYKIRI